MTLHDRLEAAINERLAVAQAAGGQSWKTSMISLYMNGNEDGAIRPVSGGPFVIQGRFVGGVATHVVANDPARVHLHRDRRPCRRRIRHHHRGVLMSNLPAYAKTTRQEIVADVLAQGYDALMLTDQYHADVAERVVAALDEDDAFGRPPALDPAHCRATYLRDGKGE